MPFAATCIIPDALHELDIIARELAALRERLEDAATAARTLSRLTHWHSEAATAFRASADLWAGDVSGLGCLAETARGAAERDRDRLAMATWQGCG